MREIILDTETTGLDPLADRLVEIGCVELINHIPTGRHFHSYLKPDRRMSPDAERVHGLSEAFLADKPRFAAVVEDFLAFIEGAQLVAHNAGFDMGFVNAELGRLGKIPVEPSKVVDTLALARRRHPAAPNSLDALCARYGIDTAKRVFHGALLDAQLLAEVYVELLGGRQAALGLTLNVSSDRIAPIEALAQARAGPQERAFSVTQDEASEHEALVRRLGAKPLWQDYLAKG